MGRAPSRLFAVAVLLSLSFTFLVTDLDVAAQTPRPPDLALKSVSIIGPGPRWIFEEARNATVRVVVENQGETAAPYRLLFQWRTSGNIVFLNEDELHSTDVSDAGPLLGGASRPHDVTWRVQPTQVGAGEIVVSISGPDGGAADSNPLNDKGVADGTVPKWAARLEVGGRPQPLHRGETGFMDVRLVNEGTMPFTGVFTVTDAAQGNRTRFVTSVEPSNVDVGITGPSRTAEAGLFVTSSLDSRDETLVVNNFSLRVDLGFDQRNLTVPTPNVTTATGSPPTNQSMSVDVPRDDVWFVPDHGSRALALNITNTGGEDDTYRLNVVTSSGWSASASALHVGLHRGSMRTIPIVVGSGTLPRGSGGSLDVFVVSEHGVAQFSHRVPLQVAGPAVAVGPIETVPAQWYVNETLGVAVSLTNEGNLPSSGDAALRVRVSLPGMQSGPDTTIKQTIPAVSTRRVEVPLGSVTMGGAATIVVSWASGDGSVEPASLSSSAFIHAPRLRLEAPAFGGRGVAGEAVAYRDPGHVFRVTNIGNARETFEAKVSSFQGGARIEGPESFELGVGESRFLPFFHELPSFTGPNRHVNATVTVSVRGHPAFSWEEEVSTALEDRTAPSVDWDSSSPNLWTLGKDLRIKVRADDAADIRNATVRVTRPDGVSVPLVLERQADGAWEATYRPTLEGNYSMRAWAADVFLNVGSASSRALEVRALPEPTVEIVRPLVGENVTVGSTLGLRIVNVVGEARVRVFAINADESVIFFDFTRDGVEEWTNLTIPTGETGAMRIHVEVWNDVGGSGEDSVEVKFEAPPEPPSDDGKPASVSPSKGSPGWPAWSILLVLAAVAMRLARRADP